MRAKSSAIAIGLTILFMAVYYRTGGAIADFALVFTVIFLLAVLAAFQGTLTMPGIAGIILTLAVAVDANVLIYERIREETAGGKTPRAAIDAGYSKAFTAIFDSNLTAHHRCDPLPVRDRAGAGVCADADDRYRRQSLQRHRHHARGVRHDGRPHRHRRQFRLTRKRDSAHEVLRKNQH